MTEPWEIWENEVNGALGLSGTAGSGSQWHDKGDGVDRRHHSETDYAIQADAKYTQRGSYSINAKLMRQWADQALETGKSFVLPVRIWPRATRQPNDYAVIPWHDYLMLVDHYRSHE